MSLTPNDLKRGVIFYLDDQLYESLEYKQKVHARQQASVTIKARNLTTNKLISYTFRGGEDLRLVDLTKLTVEFLYEEKGIFHFMDPTDFTQYELKAEMLAEKTVYISAGQKFILVLVDAQPLVIELPKNVWLTVEHAPQVVKGDTSTSILKEVRLSTGLVVKAPAFIKVGDVISIDTASGAYRERKK